METEFALQISNALSFIPGATANFTGVIVTGLTIPTPVNPTDAANKAYVDTGRQVGTYGGNVTTSGYLQANGIAGSAIVSGITSVPMSTLDIVMPTAMMISKATFITNTGDTTSQYSILKNGSV